MGYPITQSQAAQPLVFFIAQTADHITGLTGASPTVTLSKNGAAFASPSGAVTEIANGWYKVAGNATDSGTLGPLLLHATATSGDPTDDCFPVVAYGMQDGVHLGLTAIPNVASGSAGALLVDGTGTAAISNSGGKVLLQATQSGVTIPTVTTVSGSVGSVTGSVGSVTGLTASNLDAAVSSRMATYTQPTGFLAATFPTTVSSFAGGAVASVTGNVGGSVGSVVGLTASNLDATISSRLAASAYTAPDNADIALIVAQTNKLTFTISNVLDANIHYVNDVKVNGNGQPATPWGP